jgi:hypothetical protein
MRKEFRYPMIAVLCFFVGGLVGCEDIRIQGPLDKTADPIAEENPDPIATYAHFTKTVNNDNTNCTTSPPLHVQAPPQNPAYQWIPTSNPKFCWNTFGNNITSWSFILKTQGGAPVAGCNTAGYPAKVPPTTTSLVCNVNLSSNTYYIGYLTHVYNNATYTDLHQYKTP